MYNCSETNRVRWIKLKRASEPVEDWIKVDQNDFDKVPDLLANLLR